MTRNQASFDPGLYTGGRMTRSSYNSEREVATESAGGVSTRPRRMNAWQQRQNSMYIE